MHGARRSVWRALIALKASETGPRAGSAAAAASVGSKGWADCRATALMNPLAMAPCAAAAAAAGALRTRSAVRRPGSRARRGLV